MNYSTFIENMMKFFLVMCFLLSDLSSSAESTFVGSKEVKKIQRQRIAIFSEEGFPSKSPRSVSWYQNILQGEGLSVSLIGVRDLCDPQVVNSKKFDTLILPTGGYLPYKSDESIGLFLNGGGTVLVDENLYTSKWKEPPEVSVERGRLLTLCKKGRSVEEYHEFVEKNGVSPGNGTGHTIFSYSEELKRWILPVVNYCYLQQLSADVFSEFGLESWPNYCGGGYSYYARPFTEDLVLNPNLKDLGLPEIIPCKIRLDGFEDSPIPGLPKTQIEFVASSAKEDGFHRMRIPSRGGTIFPENSNDLLLPLYLFKDVSKISYPSFEKAGKDFKDKESDFYIYRSHLPYRNGATLVHLGVAGAHLLRSDVGASVLLQCLRLAESRLPGEISPERIAVYHQLGENLSQYYGKVIPLIESLMKEVTLYQYRQQNEKRDEVLSKISFFRKQYENISSLGVATLKRPCDENGSKAHSDLNQKLLSLLVPADQELNRSRETLNVRDISVKFDSVQSHFKRLKYGIGTPSPGGITRLKTLLPMFKEMGLTYGYYMSDVGGIDRGEELFRLYGFQTGYRLHALNSGSFYQSDISVGTLNLRTGNIDFAKWRWYDNSEDWSNFEKSAGWFLKRVNRSRAIDAVCYLDERDFGWTFWDQRMLDRFKNYLKSKYSSIERLNIAWGSSISSFSDIVLPLKRPVTSVEHALWEDWTRYREVYHLNEEVLPQLEIVKKYAPDKESAVYGSYYQQPDHPANGINYYEIGKYFDPNTLEMGPALHQEILTADISGFHSRNRTHEWSAFYYPPSSYPDKTDLLKQEIWKGIGWGQIGIQTFIGSQAGEYGGGNLIDLANHPLPTGYQFKEITSDLFKVQSILLDGKRKEPEIRILYSPTTRRHTSWPEVERDLSMDEVCGYYLGFQKCHIPARAIDEQAVMEGHLSSLCRLLILSQVSYLNDDLLKKLKEFVQQGGNLLITADSGSCNEYGKSKDTLMAMAEVSETLLKSAIVDLPGGGTLDLSAQSKSKALLGMFPERTKTFMKYRSGESVLSCTPVGKGAIWVLGFPFGESFYKQWSRDVGSTSSALSFLKTMMKVMSIDSDYLCSDPMITVRPWLYHGKEYLVLTSMTRDGLSQQQGKEGDFPFQKASIVQPFELKIRGKFEVLDCVLGIKPMLKTEGEYTIVKGMIGCPGGVILELTGSRDEKKLKGTSPLDSATDVSMKSHVESVNSKSKQRKLPFTGQIYLEDGVVQLGDFKVRLSTEEKGVSWSGVLFMNVELDGENIRLPLVDGEISTFHFLGKSLKVRCQKAISVMPGNVIGTFEEIESKKILQECRVQEEMFHGQKSIVIENGYLRTRWLPQMGGNLIEFISKIDGVNHLYCNPNLIQKGFTESIVSFGGLVENAGAYPGPFWNLNFEYQIVKNSSEEVCIRFPRCKPSSWDYGVRGSGVNSLEKEIVIRKSDAKIHLRYRLYNDRSETDHLCLRLHPEMAVGGKVSQSIGLFYPVGNRFQYLPFPKADLLTERPCEGGWIAAIDKNSKKGIVQVFDPKDVKSIYACKTENFFTYEITTVQHKMKSQDSLVFDVQWGLIQGLPGLSSFRDDLGIWFETREGLNENDSEVPFSLQISALRELNVHGELEIESNGKREKWKQFKWNVKPDCPVNQVCSWNTAKYLDGKYRVWVFLRNESNEVISEYSHEFELNRSQKKNLLAEINNYRNRFDSIRKNLNFQNTNSDNENKKMILSRIFILLGSMEKVVAENQFGKINLLREELQKTFKQLDD